ncbi:hypothetical protein BDV59DRAFT_21889 [Aspergillus ambiguus]|uniref:uncharacterized protein n=1 Tax=Aspergillus ambiguus TaxID=176160 RepID=UPI003CCD42EE
MPRSRGKPKQTRLSFAPVSPSSQAAEPIQIADDGADRRANLRYEHPSLPILRKDKPRPLESKMSSPFVEAKPAEKKSRSKSEKRKRKSSKKNKKKEKPIELSDTDEVITVEQGSESDDPLQGSTHEDKTRQSVKRKRSPSPIVVDPSPPPEPSRAAASDESDAEEIVSRPGRKIRRGTAPQPPTVLDTSEESEDEPVRSSPVKRRRLLRSSEAPQTPRRELDQDRLDIEEDLEDLQDSVVKETRTRGRLANSVRAQRQQHLEALRRRRAGDKKSTDVDEEQSESEPESSASGSESDESAIQQPRLRHEKNDSDVESSVPSDEDLDRYEDDFVLEDEEDRLGVPTDLQGVPFEFTRHAYKQLKDYFQDAVEWMVHNQLNPAFPRSSPVYEFAFTKLEDEVKGRTGSQLVSSVWNAAFRRALLARPQMEITAYPTSDNHPCDACNRSGHPASFDIKFCGKAYSLETLEPLTDETSDNDDDDESEKEDDGEEHDRDGYVLPSEDTRFYLGRHCKTKAEMAHTLTHWRCHLNEWVVEHLRQTGYLSDDAILRRSHWSQKRKEKYAAEAMRTMIENDEIKKLWRDFHINLKTAREAATNTR